MLKMKKVSIPIIRRNFNTTKAARFKGVLDIVSNDKGIVFDWRVNFTHVDFDAMTTERWFDEKEKMYLDRKSFLNEIDNSFSQIKRPFRTRKTELHELNEKELKTLNKFLNDRTKYSGSIKNLVTFIKGSNPRGEASNPGAAELIIDTKGSASSFENFVILLDDLKLRKNHRESEKNLFDMHSMNAEEISLEEFANLNNELHAAFKYMQSEKNSNEFKVYLKNIKQYYRKYNNFVDKANDIVAKARSRYSKNIDEYVLDLPFGLEEKSQFQKAHIIDVHKIKLKIVEALMLEKGYERMVKMIEDPQNFIPLIESIHRQFDSNNISYDLNGEMIALNEKGQHFIDKYADEQFKHIDEFFWTEKRQQYIEERNNNS
ncbi:MAG: hypothetical protein HRT98_02475 [Mycoplasmatales bacterium]|nr:hypothetical protein [Mycoplasmatales bacterium]